MFNEKRIEELEKKVTMLLAEQSFMLNNKPIFNIGGSYKGIKILRVDINHEWIDHSFEKPYYEYVCACAYCNEVKIYSEEHLINLNGVKNKKK